MNSTKWTERNSSGSCTTSITGSCTQSPCRLKKVQGKKKRDADKAEAAKKIEASADGETGDEFKAGEAPSTTEQAGNLLNDKDEDIIF